MAFSRDTSVTLLEARCFLKGDVSVAWSDGSGAYERILATGEPDNVGVIEFHFKLNKSKKSLTWHFSKSHSYPNTNAAEETHKLRYKILTAENSAYTNPTAETPYDAVIVPFYTYEQKTAESVGVDFTITPASSFKANTDYYLYFWTNTIPSNTSYEALWWRKASSTSYAYQYTDIIGSEDADGTARIDNGSSLDEYAAWIDNGSAFEQYMPYIDNGSSWELYGG